MLISPNFGNSGRGSNRTIGSSNLSNSLSSLEEFHNQIVQDSIHRNREIMRESSPIADECRWPSIEIFRQ